MLSRVCQSCGHGGAGPDMSDSRDLPARDLREHQCTPLHEHDRSPLTFLHRPSSEHELNCHSIIYINCQVLEFDQFINEAMIKHLQAECSLGVRVCCSTREQVKPASALTMRRMAFMLVLLFPALTFVAVGLFTQPHGALPSLTREPNRVHTSRFGSRSRLTRVIIPAVDVDEEGEITKEEITKHQHSRNVRARRLHALVSDGKCNTVATIFRLAVSRRLGPSNDPARLSGRPIKLFIICANRGLRKVKKVGIKVTLASPRAAPTNQHVVPFENHHRRRALKQLPQVQVSPLPFALPSVPLISPPSPQLRIPSLPPLLLTPPLPQLQIPPLPFFSPASPQRQDRPPSITFPQVPSPPFLSIPTLPVTLPTPVLPLPGASVLPKHLNLPPLPPLPFQIPPLPFQIPPLPCEPSSSGKSLSTP